MDDDYQSFRTAPDGEITRIEVFTDQENGLRVVFWEDIESQYPGIHCVKNGDIAISFARDSNRRRLDPLCIKHQPGVVLDVVLASDSHAHIRHKTTFSHSASNSVSSLSIQSPGGSNPQNYALDYHAPPAGAFSHLSIDTPPESLSDHAGHLLPLNSPLVRSRSNSVAPPSPLGSMPTHLPAPGTIATSPTTPTAPNTPPATTTTTTTTLAVTRIQSTLQTSAHLFNHFEQSIKSGQLHQAESIKQEIRTALELDFCHHLGPSRDILNRHRRYDPILQIIATAKLQTLHLKRCNASSTVPVSAMIQLRTLSVQGTIESGWKTDQARLEDLLRSSPRLTELRLQCLDVDAMFETIKNATDGLQMLQTLHLMVNQSGLQEHVDIEIAQPQQEIASIRIESNKSLCTNLVYSGQVRRLVLYHEFDVAAAQKINMKRIFERNSELHHFGAVCMVKDFVPILECLQAASTGHPALAYLELQDNVRRNSVVMRPLSTDSNRTHGDSENKVKKPRVQLQLKGSDSAGREEIFRALGWSLSKIPLGFQFTAGMARALVGSMQSNGSVLQSLHANITDLKIDCLEPLATVIEISRDTVTVVDILLWAKQASHEGMLANTKALARFLVRISAQITRLNLRAFGLSALLKELGPAATAAAEAAARTAAQAPSLFPFASNTRRSITSLPGNHYLRGDFTQGSTSHGGVSVTRSVTTVRKPAAIAPQIVMSMLREFEIQPEADSSGKMIHCQINTPDLQWLSIPLSSPVLRTVKLGYFDILTFGWTVVLQSLRFETIQVLTLEGTNFWDGQVKVLIECLEKTRARHGVWKAAPPQVHGMEVGVEEGNSSGRKVQDGGTTEGVIALKELAIKGSLISPPVLAGLETQVHEIVPGCRVLTSGAK
ncbi:hypothetical protein KVV02_002695 [Mortierella alpina]|uniref:Uncharacterized protein n=1 Tax=Mortierella alpina TaxID=64518 RepID=A0A9P8IF78_MORAP|nr:hypothetical protein KVV02_002695 [Mortierella alpina]